MKYKLKKWMQKRHKHIFPSWFVQGYILYYKWCKTNIRTWSKTDILHAKTTQVHSTFYAKADSECLEEYSPSTESEIVDANSVNIDRKDDTIATSKQFWLSCNSLSGQDKASLFSFRSPDKWISPRPYDTVYIKLDANKYMTRIAQVQVFLLRRKLPKAILDYIVLFVVDTLERDIKNSGCTCDQCLFVD